MSFFTSSTDTHKKSEQSERMARISEKLNMINLTNSANRARRSNGTQEKVAKIQDKIGQITKAVEANVGKSKESVEGLRKKAETMRSSNNKDHEVRMQKIYALEGKIIELIDAESELRKETERHLMRIIEDKASVLEEEVRRHVSSRDQCFEDISSSIYADIPKIHSMLNEETKERESKEREIKQGLQHQIDLVSVKLEEESKNRQQDQQNVYDSFSNIVNTIKKEFQKQKHDMEKNSDKLLLLLKQTCTKIELETSRQDILP